MPVNGLLLTPPVQINSHTLSPPPFFFPVQKLCLHFSNSVSGTFFILVIQCTRGRKQGKFCVRMSLNDCTLKCTSGNSTIPVGPENLPVTKSVKLSLTQDFTNSPGHRYLSVSCPHTPSSFPEHLLLSCVSENTTQNAFILNQQFSFNQCNNMSQTVSYRITNYRPSLTYSTNILLYVCAHIWLQI